MDFVRAIKFPLDDENWITKVVVGALLNLIPIFGIGYTVGVARNVVHGKARPLPGTEDLGQVITDGIMASIAAVVYALPVLLVGCVVGIFGSIIGNSDVGGLFAACLSMVVSLSALIYAIPATAMYWLGVMHYTESGNFSDFVRFGALLREVRQHIGALVMLLLYVLVIGLLGALIAPILIVTCVGILVLSFWIQIAYGHLIGQAALEIEQAR